MTSPRRGRARVLARWATVTRPRRPDSSTEQPFGRRGLLRAGLALTMAGPALAACTSTPTPPAPDALLPVLRAARQDVTSATSAATVFPDDAATWQLIAMVRQQHADALAREITRAGSTLPAMSAASASSAPAAGTGSEPDALSQIATALHTAQQQAAALAPTAPRYRAGLLGSVSAGCASMLEALRT
jgi:hypothetical protein